MHRPRILSRICVLLLLVGLAAYGCQSLKQQVSDGLTRWKMLDPQAVENPIQAVGGDGIVFTPHEHSRPLTRQQLAAADPATLVNYYAPIFVQQRVDAAAH
jgi:hypothetical protein